MLLHSCEWHVIIRIGLNSNKVSSKMVYICGKGDMETNYKISSLIYYEIPVEIR